ncbi:MAG: hypothetical protein NDI88_07540 [Lysobacter sp.]|nr:hypothetical protein [Lysobacter sp.]
MQLQMTFKDAPGVRVSMLHSDLAVLTAEALVAVVKGQLPHVIRFPGGTHSVRLANLKEGIAYCAYLTGVVKGANEQEQEARRKAGFSPRSEEGHLSFDAMGNPIAIRKVFRY